MHFNIADVVVGGLLIITSVIYRTHLLKQPDSPLMRKLRVLTILTMIIGWMIVVWDPVWALAFTRH